MELTILQPLNIRMPEGPQLFHPGQIIDLPHRVALRLLELAPGKIRRADEATCFIGQQVQYRIPTNIKGPHTYTWKEYTGTVAVIDESNHLALIVPDDETLTWRWVSLVYVEPG